MLTEYITPKLLDAIYEKLSQAKEGAPEPVALIKRDLEKALSHHLRFAKNWSSEISFRDLRAPHSIESAYIDLDLLLTPRHLHISPSEREQAISSKAILTAPELENITILGQPGAGKTTTLKHICWTLLAGDDKNFSRFDFPVVIRLRELARDGQKSPLAHTMLSAVGVEVSEQGRDSRQTMERILADTFGDLKALILLDGLDEISPDLRRPIQEEIEKISYSLESSAFVLTSRSADYNLNLSRTSVFELRPLEEVQIARFALSYLRDEDLTEKFLSQLRPSPYYDASIRPLNLAHLCAIFERLQQIPDKPKTIYRKLVSLLLEEWDEQKPLRRRSRYGNFETDRKREFLSHLAYELTLRRKIVEFSKDDLYSVYVTELCAAFSMNQDDASNVIRELESHTGLILQSGIDTYEFAHGSLQEYLAAEHIVRLPSFPQEIAIFINMPSELAIAVALSSDPDAYLGDVLATAASGASEIPGVKFTETGLARKLSTGFIPQFFDRILVEKVDFRYSIVLGVALLKFYTWLRRFHLDREMSEATSILENFIASPNVSLAVERLLDHYDAISKARTGDFKLFLRAGSTFNGPKSLDCKPELIGWED